MLSSSLVAFLAGAERAQVFYRFRRQGPPAHARENRPRRLLHRHHSRPGASIGFRDPVVRFGDRNLLLVARFSSWFCSIRCRPIAIVVASISMIALGCVTA